MILGKRLIFRILIYDLDLKGAALHWHKIDFKKLNKTAFLSDIVQMVLSSFLPAVPLTERVFMCWP